jgi:hypothetical protein
LEIEILTGLDLERSWNKEIGILGDGRSRKAMSKGMNDEGGRMWRDCPERRIKGAIQAGKERQVHN